MYGRKDLTYFTPETFKYLWHLRISDQLAALLHQKHKTKCQKAIIMIDTYYMLIINIWIIQILIIIINIWIIQIIIIILMSCRPCMLQVTLLGLYNNNYYKNYSYNSTLMIFTFLWYSSFSFATAQVALKTVKIINIELFQSTVHIPLHNFYVLITSHNNFYVLNLSLVKLFAFLTWCAHANWLWIIII